MYSILLNMGISIYSKKVFFLILNRIPLGALQTQTGVMSYVRYILAKYFTVSKFLMYQNKLEVLQWSTKDMNLLTQLELILDKSSSGKF